MKRKIIFTVNTYFPLKDGVQNVTQYHAEGLAAKGYDVIVITPLYDNLKEDEWHNNVFIKRINIKTSNSFYSGDKKFYLDTIMKETKDAHALINVCMQTPTTDWIFQILDQISCKKILYVHGMFDFKWHRWDFMSIGTIAHKGWNGIRWGIYYSTIKKYLIKYDEIIQLHKFDLATLFFKENYNISCKIIGNAADEEFFEKVESKNDKYAISVANYMDRKNQIDTLRAFYKAEVQNEFGLVLIGSKKNAYYDQLIEEKEKLEEKYGHKSVQILTNISREKTISYIKNASLYLMNSKWEAFPVSIVESMAAGIPYITTDVGCNKYLPGGIVVKNIEEMSYWINLLEYNQEIGRVIGKAGSIYAMRYLTKESVINELEKVILNNE